MELWNGTIPCIAHLKVFGSKTYSKIPDEKRKKFDDKAKLMKLVGYCEDSKGFRLLDVEMNKITISRDVKFVENDSSSATSLRRSERNKNKPPVRYAYKISFEPSCMHEALKSVDKEEWIKAMDNEFNSLIENNTWDLVK